MLSAARSLTRVYNAFLHDTGLQITQFTIMAAFALDRYRHARPSRRYAGAGAHDASAQHRPVAPGRAGRSSASVARNAARSAGRSKRFDLTPAGRAALEGALPAWEKAQQAFGAALGEERNGRDARYAAPTYAAPPTASPTHAVRRRADDPPPAGAFPRMSTLQSSRRPRGVPPQATPRYGVVSTAELTAVSGLEFLRGIMDGRYPAPPIAETCAFEPVAVEHGFVAFDAQPGPLYLNPLGHGAWRLELHAARHGDGLRRPFHAEARPGLHDAGVQDPLRPAHPGDHRQRSAPRAS